VVAALVQGQVWWAELPAHVGSGPGFRRPVVVVQGNAFNRSRVGTVVVVPLTRNLRLAEPPGSVLLARKHTGLSSDSVANVAQIVTLDRELLVEQVGQLSAQHLSLVLAGIDLVLGR
jgi:mRNA interferase MazF